MALGSGLCRSSHIYEIMVNLTLHSKEFLLVLHCRHVAARELDHRAFTVAKRLHNTAAGCHKKFKYDKKKNADNDGGGEFFPLHLLLYGMRLLWTYFERSDCLADKTLSLHKLLYVEAVLVWYSIYNIHAWSCYL